jgi:replicative DNA helicase
MGQSIQRRRATPEDYLICAALLDPQLVNQVSVSAEHFSSTSNAAVWAEILKQVKAGQTPDHASVGVAVGEHGVAMIGQIVDAAAPSTIPSQIASYAEAVKKNSRRVFLQKYLAELRGHLRSGDPDPHISDAMATLSGLASGMSSRERKLGSLIMEYYDKLVAYRLTGKARTAPTGLNRVDAALTGGGFAKGALHIVAGSTSVGKSSLCQTIAYNCAARGLSVDFYSYEDDPVACSVRILSRISGVDNRTLQGFDAPPAVDDEIKAAWEQTGGWDVAFFDTDRDIETLALEATSNALRRKTDVIVVDYIQKLVSRKRRESRNYEVGHIAAELFTVARRTGAAVVVASQLRRNEAGKKDARPALHDLRDSGELEQHAHTVILLHRDKLDSSGLTEAIIAKQKNGPICDVPILFDPKSSSFRDVEGIDALRYEEKKRDGVRRPSPSAVAKPLAARAEPAEARDWFADH